MYIRKQGGALGRGLPQEHAIHCEQQIAAGVAYLHQENIAHTDLKPENVVVGDIDSQDKEDGTQRLPTLKLIDFRHVISPIKPQTEVTGTPPFVAPEVIVPNPRYDPCIADVWSLGVIFIELDGRPSLFRHSSG